MYWKDTFTGLMTPCLNLAVSIRIQRYQAWRLRLLVSRFQYQIIHRITVSCVIYQVFNSFCYGPLWNLEWTSSQGPYSFVKGEVLPPCFMLLERYTGIFWLSKGETFSSAMWSRRHELNTPVLGFPVNWIMFLVERQVSADSHDTAEGAA